ncbi:YgjV family protein, partial [Streptococcus suis]
VSYTIAIQMTSSTQILRFVIIENMLLWFIYDVTIRAYPAAIMDIVITLLSAVSIWRFYQKKTS